MLNGVSVLAESSRRILHTLGFLAQEVALEDKARLLKVLLKRLAHLELDLRLCLRRTEQLFR